MKEGKGRWKKVGWAKEERKGERGMESERGRPRNGERIDDVNNRARYKIQTKCILKSRQYPNNVCVHRINNKTLISTYMCTEKNKKTKNKP